MKLAEIRDRFVVLEYLNEFGRKFAFVEPYNRSIVAIEVSSDFYAWMVTTSCSGGMISVLAWLNNNNLIADLGGQVTWVIGGNSTCH